jgi:hypothetical protein
LAIKKKYGPEYYSIIGKLGGVKSKRKPVATKG